MKIKFVGCGVLGCRQMTLEGLEAISTANKLLYFQLTDDEIKDLSRFVTLPPCESIEDEYLDQGIDQENYERLKRRVMDAVATYADIAILIQGHPLVGVSLIKMIQQEKQNHNFELEIIAGISSFDSMMIDVLKDPLERGTSLIDVNRLLLFNYNICPELDLYLYHGSSVANAHTDFTKPDERNQVGLLQEYLLRFYPSTHPCQIIGSRREDNGQSRIVTLMLSELEQNLSSLGYDTSLFIPALKPKTINGHVLKLIQSR